MTELDFSGRTALITGAASGIGAACADWLADHGIRKLILVDNDEEGLRRLALACEIAIYVGDVADPALWDRIETEAGPLQHAILNAGIGAGAPLAQMSFEEWRKVMSVNLDGAFLSLRTALRLFGDGASAVLTASAMALKAEPATAAYGASKAAVIKLAKTAAKESAARGIRVNAIAPGGVDTPIWDKQPMFAQAMEAMGREAALDAMAKQSVPLGRFATADEIAGQIGFLLSDMAKNVTGAVLVSDGAYSI